MNRTGRIAVVPARYGNGVVGGAETVLRELAHGLAARGWPVDVLTTCARDHFTWADEFPPGPSRDGDLVVRRFPAVVASRRVRGALNAAIVSGQWLDVDTQLRWINADLRLPTLFDYLLAHGHEYRTVVLAPYLFWPAFTFGQLLPERAVLMPCLHDEPEAHLEIFHRLFANVRGIWFLSEPERELAASIFPRLADHQTIGSGIAVPEQYEPARFRVRHGIDGRFVLYAGRREAGKNWRRLLAGFEAALERSPALPFSLVTVGSSSIDVPRALADRVIDLGFVSDEDRDDAFAAADAYVQPSDYESFSRTMMEAWLAGTPVIASAGAAVNRWHCARSGGGLLYEDSFELEECLRFVAEAPVAAAALAARGRAYALEHAAWPRVLDAAETTLESWFPQESAA